MSLSDKIKNIDKRQLFFLLLIFIIGFGFRAHLLKYELFFEFDSYWHARMTADIIQTGTYHIPDPMSYYQLGGAPPSYTGIGFWYITAAIYKVFSLPFTLGAYSKDLWIWFVKVLPAIFGALTSIAMFFFFKEMYGKRAGYLAGFFTAISSGYIYRTMAGFFEGGSLLFFFMVLGLYFAARALKKIEFNKKTIIDGLLAGFFLGVTGWIGGWYLIVPYILLAFIAAGSLILWFKNENAMDFLKIVGIIIVVFAVINAPMPSHPGLASFGAVFDYLKPYIGLAPSTIPTPSEAEGDIGAVFRASVGEQSRGWTSFGTKYNALSIFSAVPVSSLKDPETGIILQTIPGIAFFLLLLAIFRKNEKSHFALLLFIWIFLTYAMAWNRLQLTFAYGLGLAAAAAFSTNEIFELVKKRTPFERQALSIGLLLFVFIGVAQAALFTSDQVPNIESDAGWKDALNYLRTSTPADSKIFNWWDEGHWISFIGERKALLDNRNLDLNGDSAVALAIVTTDINQACGIIQGYGSDYAIFGEDLMAKQQSLALYGYRTLSGSNPNLQGFGTVITVSCSNQNGIYTCGGNTWNEQQIDAIPVQWSNVPVRPLEDGRTLLYAYRNAEKTYVYFVIGTRTNESFIVRAWFNDPNVYCLKPVFGEQAKVFQVKYS